MSKTKRIFVETAAAIGLTAGVGSMMHGSINALETFDKIGSDTRVAGNLMSHEQQQQADDANAAVFSGVEALVGLGVAAASVVGREDAVSKLKRRASLRSSRAR